MTGDEGCGKHGGGWGKMNGLCVQVCDPVSSVICTPLMNDAWWHRNSCIWLWCMVKGALDTNTKQENNNSSK